MIVPMRAGRAGIVIGVLVALTACRQSRTPDAHLSSRPAELS